MPDISSTKPYLLRAIYEWCVDNGFTPYVSVAVNADTRVPMEYVRDGEIVLNIGPLASQHLQIGSEWLECAARFGGVAREICVPITAIREIYSRENGQGMAFAVPEGKSGIDKEAPGRLQSNLHQTRPKREDAPPCDALNKAYVRQGSLD